MTLDTRRDLPLEDFDDESPDALTLSQAVSPRPPRRRARGSRSKSRRLAVVGAVILAAIGFLVFKGLTSAIVFFKTANEAVAERAQLGNADFQIEGTVVHGSVRHLRTDVYRFAIASSGVTVKIENTGNPPQMFRPGIPVVLVGHFVGSSNLFASNEIMVKHSAAYIAAHPGRVRASPAKSS
ncbi:MAG: cytochrome c maturation protein CcmE [Actinomycetota bacterium]|nr:cytochrome c maturation protein CcmE [Actinomycetota bacterium]